MSRPAHIRCQCEACSAFRLAVALLLIAFGIMLVVGAAMGVADRQPMLIDGGSR
jgi:hypothetical protein